MKRMLLSAIVCGALTAFAADEITVNCSVKLVSGNVSQSQASGDLRYDMNAASPAYNGGISTLTWDAPTALPVGGVTSNGYLWIKNASSSPFVENGGATTNVGGQWIQAGVSNTGAAIAWFAKFYTNEVGVIPIDPAASIWFRACTSSVPVQTFLITR